MKKTAYFFALITLITFAQSCSPVAKPQQTQPANTALGEQGVEEYKADNYYTGGSGYVAPGYELGTELKKVKANYLSVKKYAAKNNCSGDYIFVINMRIPCYKKRFFVYNAVKDSLVETALVSHGIGSETFKGELIFSNVPNSMCSSLGKYKIGESYKGIWGFSYRLRGLDSTNSKALERAVVLHSYPTIPDKEIGTSPVVFSHGCPMVSPVFLEKLKGYISKAKKPILLSIIY
jgi:L,D-transpeptidase catalytic domain